MEEKKKITGEILIKKAKILEIESEVKNLSDYKEKIEEYLKYETTELMEIILAGALIMESSDIHLQPEKKEVELRIRIDGILQDVVRFEPSIYKSLLSRIKLLSGIKLNISDRPQDGRFSILLEEKTIEIRASTLPAEYGESTVLRLLNPASLIELETLGLKDNLLSQVNKEIRRPNGMIIVTGPTGSGKSTTLYAVLKKISSPEIKIITIEDPIEYHLEEISQTQVDPTKGYDFASGLKAIMRQDPDVILVGEIRDLETVNIALQASLTGHLVLTTLHTNDAAGAIARLISLGAKLSNIAPALNMVIAQRLIRKVCKNCAQFKEVSPEEIALIKEELEETPYWQGVKDRLKGIKVPKAVGCKDCNLAGYKGRVGVFEIFPVDEEMERVILKNPSMVELKELAIKKGMIAMKQDGLLKAIEGITTIEELERVVG